MNYKFVKDANYEDFSGGKVIYHQPGFTNYPVRLACEIFMRCLAKINKAKVNIYDPCCGGGYILTVLGFLYGDRIGCIYGSDISTGAVTLTEKNLQLLSLTGLLRRKEELDTLYRNYRKDSHKQAVRSTQRLMEMLHSNEICYRVFKRDVLAEKVICPITNMDIDIVITDVPYGNLIEWSASDPFVIDTMLDNIKHDLNSGAVIAVSSDKRQKISNPAYVRFEKFVAGKRKVEILRRDENE